ncbi:MAG: hypothetical protein Ta2F_17950 [Termitinemataceae bacterium]|nr:MAG: hypothetical protein Ta2F_17950 [Termitinemataceae bacterium]
MGEINRHELSLGAKKKYDFFIGRGFKPITKDSYFDLAKHKYNSKLAASQPLLLTSWSFAFHNLYCFLENYLCVIYFYDNDIMFSLIKIEDSDSDSKQNIIDKLYNMCMEAGCLKLSICLIEESELSNFANVSGYNIETNYCDDNSEYVFNPLDILALDGGVNKKKRERFKLCFADKDTDITVMDGSGMQKVLEIEDEWCGHNDCTLCSSFIGCEKTTLKTMIDLFDKKIHTGFYMESGGEIIGYMLTELKNNVAYCYLGKSNKSNYFPYFFFLLAEKYFKNVDYMNLDEDLGNQGLRMFKRGLGKYTLWRKYDCVYRRIG